MKSAAPHSALVGGRASPSALADGSGTAAAGWLRASDSGAPTLSVQAVRLWQRRRVRIGGVLLLLILAALLGALVWPAWAWLAWVGLDSPPAVVLAVFLAALLCEFVDSSLGMGYGTTLAPLLLIFGFDPLEIVPAILLSECITGLFGGWMHQRDGNVDFLRDRRATAAAGLFLAATLLGVMGAVGLSSLLPRQALAVLIGLIVLGVGVLILATLRRQLRFRPGQLVAVGVVAAFNKAISGGGYGPLVTAGQVVSGLPTRSAVAITSLSEGFACLVGLVAYLLLGNRIEPGLAAPLLAGALLSVPMATLAIRRMPETGVRAAVGVGTITLGGLALLKAL